MNRYLTSRFKGMRILSMKWNRVFITAYLWLRTPSISLLFLPCGGNTYMASKIWNPPRFSPAAAKSLQSCLTLCNPIDGSPPGSPIPGILKARTLPRFHQAPPSLGFSRQEHFLDSLVMYIYPLPSHFYHSVCYSVPIRVRSLLPHQCVNT